MFRLALARRGSAVKIFAGAVSALFLVVVAVLAFQKLLPGEAKFAQSDNSGSFVLTFEDPSGVSNKSDSVMVSNNLAALAGGQTSGDLTTSEITPSSSGGWTTVKVDGTWSTADAVKVQVLDCTNTLIPDNILGGNSTGLALSNTGTINISAIPVTTACLKVKVLLNDPSGASSPAISKLTVSWLPRTVYLVRLTTTTPSVPAGNVINYKVDYSVSYADDAGTVIYVKLPTAKAGTFTASYGQDLGLSFKEASGSGAYTASAITVNGVNIPAGSVYWNLGDTKAGSTGSLTFALSTKNGWQNGVAYEATATIDSQATAATKSNLATAVISSTPAPRISKTTSNTITVDSTTYAYDQAPYNSLVNYNINYNNYSSTGAGVEALFSPVITDDLSEVVTFLTGSCNVAAGSVAGRITNISAGGVYDGAAKTITWTFGASLAPSASQQVNFTVNFSGCPTGQTVRNSATGSSVNASPVKGQATVRMFDVPVLNGAFAKGDTVNGFTSINAGRDDNLPNSDPTNMTGKTAYGDTTTYNLYAVNKGLSRLNDVVMQDIIPAGTEFVSASLPTAAQGKIFYYTGTDYADEATPPPFNYANGAANPGTGWSTTAPADPASVKWVTMYVPCLKSSIMSDAAGSCNDRPSNVTGNITVRVAKPANVCVPTDIRDTGVFHIYSGALDINQQGTVSALPNIMYLNDQEWTHAAAPLPIISSAQLTGPANIQAGDTATYKIIIGNGSKVVSTADDTTLTVNIPTIAVGNKTRPVEYLGFSGGTVETINRDSDGNVISLVVKPGALAPGASRSYSLTLAAPRGVLSGTSYNVSLTLVAHDPNGCQELRATKTQATTITGLPVLNSIKTRDQNLIDAGGTIDYHIKLNSAGTVSTSNTFIVDKIPAKSIFDSTKCNVAGCSVYFAAVGNAKLPATVTPDNPLSVDIIYNNFALGVKNGDSWTPPASMANAQVLYVAYLMGDAADAAPVLAVGDEVSIDLTVRNDDDGAGPSTDGSAPGAIIANTPVIVSDQTLQAIGNTVYTTVLSSPGLALDKTASKEFVQAGESFEWYVNYINDATQYNTVVVLNDTLPAGVTLTGLYNQWNAATIAAGATPASEYNLLDSAYAGSIKVTENADGTTSVVINLSPDQITKPMPGEGGRLRFVVKAGDDTTSGTYLLNHVEGCYKNETSGTMCLTDDSPVTVQNPDLYLRKTVSNTNPHKGDTVTYTLTVSNEGKVDAAGVALTDTLPAGMCYVTPQTPQIITGGWSLGAPIISGGDCNTNATTLTWSTANGNALKRTDLAAGVIPASSGNIAITYRVKVGDNVGYGATLNNSAKVTTTSIEDDVYPNEDSADVTTPTPDPYITKQASAPSVLPGETFAYTISYGNRANERAAGVYIVDGLPDIDGDGKTDITLLAVIPPNGETVYYYDENVSGPLPDLSAGYDFAANPAFKTSLTDFDPASASHPSYPTHLIIVNTGKNADGTLDYYENSGDITVQAQASNPYTGAELAQGSEWINYVEIGSASLDGDMTNNQSAATVAVPSADLSIAKSADVEGSYPGLAPGDALNYTVTYKNSGVGSVCGVYVTDDMPAEIASYSHDFTTVQITDARGNAMLLRDATGQAIPASTAIAATFDDSDAAHPKWYLGRTGGSTAAPDYYLNVCLPTGAQGEFHINAVTRDDLTDQTDMTNTAHIGEDSDAIEKVLANNQDSTTTIVYRSNLRLVKTATVNGPDKTFGTDDDSTTEANPSETIRYKLEYNNIGHIDAKDAVISEAVPSGTCFRGSVQNLPPTATVQYSNDGGSTWTYQPSGATDCNVTDLRVSLGDLAAPANTVSDQMNFAANLGKVGYIIDDAEILKDKDISQISAGGYSNYGYTCAISGGKVYCWGYNNSGQLGNNSTTTSLIPVAVDTSGVLAGKTVKKVSVGVYSVCVIAGNENDSNGDWAYCWGQNNNGQLGDGTTVQRNTPVQVSQGAVPSSVALIDISVGATHTCAVDSDGNGYCWGSGKYGELGDASFFPATTAAQLDYFVQKEFSQYTDLQDLLNRNPYSATTIDGFIANYCNDNSNRGGCYYYDNWGGDYQSQTLSDYVCVEIGYSCGPYNGGYTYTVTDYVETYITHFSLTPVRVQNSGALSGLSINKISAGNQYTCALASNSNIYCWGNSVNGQRGDGTITTRQEVPAAIASGEVPVGAVFTDISTSKNSYYYIYWSNSGSSNTFYMYAGNATCAIADGRAYCWGYDSNGQLGNGSVTGAQTAPVAVDTSGVLANKNVTAISSNGSNGTVCAVADDQTYCWGYNDATYPILGNGTTTNASSPVAVSAGDIPAGATATSVSVGSGHACAIADNRAYCWGYNSSGQLGDGIVVTQSTPVRIGKTITDPATTNQFDAASKIYASGTSTCAISANDQDYCWGSIVASPTPAEIPNGDIPDNATITQLSFGYSSICALAGNNIYCRSTTVGSQYTRVQRGAIPANATISQISVGYDHACAIADGLAYCWTLSNFSTSLYGGGYEGQLGDDYYIPQTTAEQMDYWAQQYGGNGMYPTPPKFQTLQAMLDYYNVSSIDQYFQQYGSSNALCGYYYDYSSDWGWGQQYNNPCNSFADWLTYYEQCQYGDCYGTQYSNVAEWTYANIQRAATAPVAVSTSGVLAGKTVTKIAAGQYYTCAVADGQTYCWGKNTSGQLGIGVSASLGANSFKFQPMQVSNGAVPNGARYTDVSLGNYSSTSCAIADGQAYCWGYGYPSLGNGSSSSTAPVAVSVSGVLANKAVTKVAVSGGSSSMTICVIADNKPYCWGYNNYGQVGDGTTANKTTPVAVNNGQMPPDATATDIAVGTTHTCVLADDQVYCWGYNSSGQVGNGFYDQEASAVPVVIAGSMASSGQRNALLSVDASADISAYNDIYIDQKTGLNVMDSDHTPNGDGGQVQYYLKTAAGGACSIDQPDAFGGATGDGSVPIWSAVANQNDSTRIDISSLSPSVKSWCVVSSYSDSGDVISTYRMSYASPDDPFVTFDAVVNSNISATKISNTASIDTATPEITKANNSDNYDVRVPQADLSLAKTADQTAVALSDAQAGTAQLTYTLTVANNGPNPSIAPIVTDNLPNGLTFVSAAQTASSDGAGGASAVNFACSAAAGAVACTSPTPLQVGETATITLVATVDSTVASGQRLMNTACAASGTADIAADNNCGQAFTTVTTAPNIYATKTGPTVANVNKEFSYVIALGNNGNAAADNWRLSDAVDSRLSVVSVDVTAAAGVDDLHCGATGQNVACTTASGSLPAGAAATVEVRVRVANDQSLADNGATIANTVCAETATTQTAVGDDCDEHDVTIIPGEAGAIAGQVFVDRSRTVQFDPLADKGLAGVTITLTGTDSKGRAVSLTTTTDRDGNYSFFNLYPGTYTVTQTQPDGYASTGSTGGYLALDVNGNAAVSSQDGQGSVQTGASADDNQITNIQIGEGDFSRANNFGEINGGIGNLVWLDANRNGQVDAGEDGIGGVEVSLFADVNNDGRYTAGVDTLVATTRTNTVGYYSFDDVATGQYIVVVTDSGGVLADGNLMSVATPAGHASDDNYSKNPSGYAVAITDDNLSNTTADFGYRVRIAPAVTVAKTDGVTDVKAGQQLTYRLTVTNSVAGSEPASGVILTDHLPGNVTFVSASDGATPVDGVLTWTDLTVADGTPVVKTVTVTVNDDVTSGGTVVNSAAAQHSSCPSDTSDNPCAADDTDTVVKRDPIVHIAKSSDVSSAQAGDEVTYAITVSNTAADSYDATDVAVTDVLPASVTLVSTSEPDGVAAPEVSDNELTWAIPTLAYDSPVTLTVTVAIGSATPAGALVHNYVTSDSPFCAAASAADADGSCNDGYDIVVETPPPVEPPTTPTKPNPPLVVLPPNTGWRNRL